VASGENQTLYNSCEQRYNLHIFYEGRMSLKDEIEFRPANVDLNSMHDPENDLNYSYAFFFKPGIEGPVRELTSAFNKKTGKGPAEGEWPETRYEFFKKGFMDPDMRIILHNGERVGCFCISTTPEAIILQRVYLRKDYQRQGIGQKLIGMALEEAHRQKKPLELEVLANNHQAIESYKKGGFEPVSEIVVSGWNQKFTMRHKNTMKYIDTPPFLNTKQIKSPAQASFTTVK
jgi:ribosomal protein S18 acetylase RimI-like enzyme